MAGSTIANLIAARQASSTGQDLLDVVIKHLNLLETSYFGLKYLDQGRYQGANHERSLQENRVLEQVWLDMNKSALKQLKDVQPMTVYFAVKYYASDPCKLAEEITRYQFFLQCKQDILHSRLPVPFDLAVELFALAVQSELGDYDPTRHQEGYVSEFHFLAHHQTPELERRVALFHRTLVGQVPATAELNFLERVRWLDLYGCELHPIQYEDNGEEYALGLNPNGVLVLRNRHKVAHYLWPQIVKTKCQTRCLLMDVLEPMVSQKSNQRQLAPGKQAARRNRFGFRLADKDSAQRLRWSIEEHKSFYHLLQNSASLSQLAPNRQRQPQKLSQKFRNSIRSAMGVGGAFAPSSSIVQQQQKILRSSIKSLNEAAAAAHLQHQQEHFVNQDRTPPNVVRMPSRRYSNRSLSRPHYPHLAVANGNGLPAAMPHTMVDSQRQQALLMMSQMNQIGPGKSHTLKPVSSSGAKNRSNAAYYQMMQMNRPDVAYLAAGQHIVQPSIYKATSVISGLNQLVAPGQTPSAKQSAMMQFFNTQPHYRPMSGHESPRSTKSAMAPSNALKLAGKKLAKHQQQQQLLYANQHIQDTEPLLAPGTYEQLVPPGPTLKPGLVYAPHQYMQLYSGNPSPKSARSHRIGASRQKSKSTHENLHLLGTEYSNAANLMGGPPPPPNYASQTGSTKKRTTFALDNDQGSLLMSAANMMPRARAPVVSGRPSGQTSDGDDDYQNPDDDDYYCSRSDCSSVQDRRERRRPEPVNMRPTGHTSSPRQEQVRSRRLSTSKHRPESPDATAHSRPRQDREDWDAIKRRHNDFSSGKGYLSNPGNMYSNPQQGYINKQEQTEDPNNNHPSVVKNMSNKQATPILLSINYDHSNANSKAVQLLNLQRQQLHSQSNNPDTGGSHFVKGSSVGSTMSSAASSPPSGNYREDAANKPLSKTLDSAASSSTTSGYYAGSNSTGTASLDSDSQTTAHGSPRAKLVNDSYVVV